jgi:exodeoxyribonuclease VII large subunit
MKKPARSAPAGRPDAAGTNVPEWTVSDLAGELKRTLEDRFGYVRLKGEISGYRGPHGSGHAYFCLKDEGAKIDAVIWRTAFARLRFKPQEGLEVVATGRITTYPGSPPTRSRSRPWSRPASAR